MEKSIEISGQTFKIRELTIEEGLNFTSTTNPKEATFEFVLKCLIEPKLTLEEIKKLSFKEGLKLITAVNDLNGMSQDFTKPKQTTAAN